MYCDLHTHSLFSDGSCTPAELIAQAKELGLTIALTDHNTVAGLPDFLAEAKKQGVRAIPGIEFSTLFRGRELHLVGLFVQSEDYAFLEGVAEKYQRLKDESNRKMVRQLNAAGYALDYQELLSRSPGGNLNRAHIARGLVEKGYVSSVQEAFEKLLDKNLPFYVPCERLQITDCIRMFRQRKIVSVLAHPLKDLTEAELRSCLPELVEAGLMALETHHSSCDDEAIVLATEIAEEFHLLPSGGSDFHGLAKPNIQLGLGKGNLRIPVSLLDDMEAARDRM